ncbi:hypothetical protein AO256_24835 [Pseudomonas syringae]|nr:hypothetical protein AO256_24835 [Pseudomonas syringae]
MGLVPQAYGDANIYVPNPRSDERTMSSVAGFLSQRLKLSLYMEMSRAAGAWVFNSFGYG